MKLPHSFLSIFLFCISVISAQEKEITLEEIYNGTFQQEGMQSLQSLNNGKEYVVLNTGDGSSSVDIYSYETGEKTGTLVDSEDLDAIDHFDNYEIGEGEKRIILGTETEDIYRRSFKGIFYVYDIQSGELIKIRAEKIQEPSLSPDGEKVAYTYNNDIYIKDLASGEVTQVTEDGEKNKIINGLADWVYEEEFSIVQAYKWNPTGEKIAFLKFDESEVPEFSMDIYGQELYPSSETFKYPKAGEKNSIVTLHMYDVSSEETSRIDLGNYSDF